MAAIRAGSKGSSNTPTKAFVGTLEVHGRTAFVTAADRRIGMRCTGAAGRTGRRAPRRLGHCGSRRVTPGRARRRQARVVKRLDPEKPVELACEAAIARFDLPREFSPEAVREAEAYGNAVDPAEAARRVDLRDLPLVTIDGEDAKDFDDAVYCEPHAKGFRLIVAIADVSYYVRRGTALDASARERGTSVYFPDARHSRCCRSRCRTCCVRCSRTSIACASRRT